MQDELGPCHLSHCRASSWTQKMSSARTVAPFCGMSLGSLFFFFFSCTFTLEGD